jgi:transcriptional regulator with XRE-family HTH domain
VNAATAREHSGAQIPVPVHGNPTIPRLLLGAQLRALRTAAGISRHTAGYAIGSSYTTIGRIELGWDSFTQQDLAELLNLYGVHDQPERDALFALAAQASTRGWWHRFPDLVPDWFEAYLGLEDAASIIRCYQSQFVPDLLQTEHYARATIRLANPLAGPDEIERRVMLRMHRARVLHRPQPPKIWAVINERVLRRPPRHEAMMRSQIEHLLTLSTLPHITLQVASPERRGDTAAGNGPFTILRLAQAALPDIVYREQLTSATCLNTDGDLDLYTIAMDQLCVEALPTIDTTTFLTETLASL